MNLAKTLILAIAVALIAPVTASAAGSAQWEDLAQRMAAPWPQIQEESGTLPDYMDDLTNPGHVHTGTRYGDGLMGAAIIQVGLRTDDRAMVDAGIRAISFATDPNRVFPAGARSDPSVFEQWGVAHAYNLLRDRLTGDPFFEKHRKRWETWLRDLKTTRFGTGRRFSNHDLVEACVVAEVLETGLSSDVPDTVLGSGRAQAEHQMLTLINTTAPNVVGSRNPAFISDPPDEPAAYHALSFALYAHIVELLGDRAKLRARIVMRRSADGSWRMAAPDADQAGWGRSQELVWAYPAAAYGAAVAAGLDDTSAEDAARYRELAQRSLDRLRIDYPVLDRGQLVAPGLAGPDPFRASRALEGYVGAPSMGGLALMFLNLALDEPGASLDGRASTLASDRDTEAIIGNGPGKFGVVRKGRIWFAVRAGRIRAGRLWSDVRYDLGLVLLKRRDGSTWRDLIPHRPNTMGRTFRDSIGPVLLAHGRRFYPAGQAIETTGSDGFKISGGWYRNKDKVSRRGAFRWEPTSCGVAMEFAGAVGDRFEMSYFFYGSQPAKTARKLAGPAQRVMTNAPFTVRFEPDYASSMAVPLVRAVIRIRAPRRGVVRLETC
jgi:hypothetical protein